MFLAKISISGCKGTHYIIHARKTTGQRIAKTGQNDQSPVEQGVHEEKQRKTFGGSENNSYFCKRINRIRLGQYMGKLMFLLYFILSVFPADASENRRHIHVVRRGGKKSHRGDTVAKIWIEENGQKKIEIAWSELNASEEAEVLQAIDDHWEELNELIDDVFAGKKIRIKRIK